MADNNEHEFGCVFVVNKKFQSQVIDFILINNRICYIRVELKFRSLYTLSVDITTKEKR